MGQGRRVDDGGGDIVRSAERGRQRDLGEDGLDLRGDKRVLDQRRDDGALADSLVAAYTDSDCGGINGGARMGKGSGGGGVPVAIAGASLLRHGGQTEGGRVQDGDGYGCQDRRKAMPALA